MCEHKFPRQENYSILQSYSKSPTCSRVSVWVCDNCPAVKVIWFTSHRPKETIVEPPIDN